MPLIGVIEQGTVVRILKSAGLAKANALVLFERGDEFGRVEFEKGNIAVAQLRDLSKEQALENLAKWNSGLYTLVKRTLPKNGVGKPVIVTGLQNERTKEIEHWVKARGFSPSVVGLPQHMVHVVNYLRPAAVITTCPKQTVNLTCEELNAAFSTTGCTMPIVVVSDDTDRRCQEPEERCQRTALSERALDTLLKSPQSEAESVNAPVFGNSPIYQYPQQSGDSAQILVARENLPIALPGMPDDPSPDELEPAPMSTTARSTQIADTGPGPLSLLGPLSLPNADDDHDDEGTAVVDPLTFRASEDNRALTIGLIIAGLSIVFLVLVLIFKFVV